MISLSILPKSHSYAVLPEKFIRIYKIINVLSDSVREEVKEDLQTALLDFALSLEDRNLNYIFVCLRNKKLDLLRGELARTAALHGEEYIEEETETEYLESPLSDIQDLGWIYDTFPSLNPTQKAFLLEMVRTAKAGRRISVNALGKRFMVSPSRVYLVLSQIRGQLIERTSENATEILSISELYDRLRRKH